MRRGISLPSKLRKNNKKPAVKVEAKDRIKKRDYAIIFLTSMSAIGAMLTLVGYGVSISVEMLNLPHETLFTSPFELLELSQWAVVKGLSKISPVDLWVFYKGVALQTLPGIVIATAVLIAGILVAKSPKKLSSAKNKLRVVGSYLFKVDQRDAVVVLIRKLVVYMVIVAAALPLAYLAVFVAILMVSVLLIAFPALGMAAGKGHIMDDVIKPRSCYPRRTREQYVQMVTAKNPQSESYAECVRVLTGKGDNQSGRVVFVTAGAIILYDPATGSVKRIPTRDAIIEVVDRL